MIFRGLLVALLLLSSLTLVTPAVAAEAKFASVDTARILASSEARKKAWSIQKKKLSAKQAEVDQLEKKIKEMKAGLDKRKSLMTPEARSELASSIQRKFREYQRLVEDNQAAIDRENGQWAKRITKTLADVIEKVGRERNYTVVFNKQQVLYVNSAIDITDHVLMRLNEATKSWF